MTQGEDSSHRFKSRLRQELDEFPLTRTQKDQLLPYLVEHATFLSGHASGTLQPDSTFFHFRRKIDAVVEHFSASYLSLENYLRAAVRQPPLFCQSPATVIANIEGVVEHFHAHGLTVSDYLRAAVKQPPLFCQSPATVIANIEEVAEHFHAHGLTTKGYLRAAVRQPQLFCQSPATVTVNIDGVAAHFHDAGLTVSDYLRAAVKQPPLFCQSPATVAANIEVVAAHFHAHGLTVSFTWPARHQAATAVLPIPGHDYPACHPYHQLVPTGISHISQRPCRSACPADETDV